MASFRAAEYTDSTTRTCSGPPERTKDDKEGGAQPELMHKILGQIRTALAVLWRPALGSVCIGAVTGVLGALLWNALNWCENNFRQNPWIICLLPAAGIVIALLYAASPGTGGTNQVLEAMRGEKRIPPVIVPLISIGTILTRMFGGSVGSEGAAIQIGGGIGAVVARWLRVSREQLRVLLMSGISGGFASVVGTPVTAIVLTIELTGSGAMLYAAVLPCAIASAVSYTVASAMGVSFPHIALAAIPVDALVVTQVVVLAALGGVVSIGLCEAIKWSGRLCSRFIPNTVLRAVVGGFVLIGLSWLAGTTAFNGGGLNLLESAAAGHAEPADFLLKILFTALTIGAGYRGGAIVPTIATGAAFGGAVGSLLGMSPALAAGIGTTSVFCGAINCPMTAFVLGIETFGMNPGLLFVLSCSVGYVCSGYTSLYSAQIIRLSKLDGHVINRRAS